MRVEYFLEILFFFFFFLPLKYKKRRKYNSLFSCLIYRIFAWYRISAKVSESLKRKKEWKEKKRMLEKEIFLFLSNRCSVKTSSPLLNFSWENRILILKTLTFSIDMILNVFFILIFRNWLSYDAGGEGGGGIWREFLKYGTLYILVAQPLRYIYISLKFHE